MANQSNKKKQEVEAILMVQQIAEKFVYRNDSVSSLFINKHLFFIVFLSNELRIESFRHFILWIQVAVWRSNQMCIVLRRVTSEFRFTCSYFQTVYSSPNLYSAYAKIT